MELRQSVFYFKEVCDCGVAFAAMKKKKKQSDWLLTLNTAQKLLAGWVQLCHATKPSHGDLWCLETLLSALFLLASYVLLLGFFSSLSNAALTEQKYQIQVR